MSSEVEVTFQVPKDRTVTHAGKPVADGEKCKVTPRQAEQLAARGLIKQPRRSARSKAGGKSTSSADE